MGEAHFPAKLPSSTRTYGSSACNPSASEYESATPSRPFLALLMLSTNYLHGALGRGCCSEELRIFTFASPRTFATWASVPGDSRREPQILLPLAWDRTSLERAL